MHERNVISMKPSKITRSSVTRSGGEDSALCLGLIRARAGCWVGGGGAGAGRQGCLDPAACTLTDSLPF